VPMTIGNEALAEATRFCEQRTPADLRDQLRLECSARGSAITIVERRAPWNPALGTDWSTLAIAQLRRDARGAWSLHWRGGDARGAWSLHWRGGDARWHLYEEVQPSRDVRPLLAEIDADPTGIFWG
jgi:hypothetical protein